MVDVDGSCHPHPPSPLLLLLSQLISGSNACRINKNIRYDTIGLRDMLGSNSKSLGNHAVSPEEENVRLH